MRHVILGNGPAGVVAAELLRKTSPKDEVIMVGCEDAPPYSRMAIPYLLVGNIDESGTYLRKTPKHFENLNIVQKNGLVKQVDPKNKQLTFVDGEKLSFDKLLIATGSKPVTPPIPGIDSKGVHSCWTLEDARSIAQIAKSGARVLQMGAGFIGCIILEALHNRGVELTVVEMGDRMVPRMMTEGAGGLIKKWVESKGVKVHTNTKVESIAPSGDALQVKLSDGSVLTVDLVIAAAGVRPNIAYLKDSGIEMATGILVDSQMRTSCPDIYAAGDVTESIDFSTGKRIVNAIQPNAAEQAHIAATNMAGGSAKSTGSLQINVLDTLGLISSSFGQWWGADQGGQHVEIKDSAAYKYLRLEFDENHLIGATSLGMTEHVGALRGLIQTRAPLGPWKAKLLLDPTRLMEAYLATAQAQSTWIS